LLKGKASSHDTGRFTASRIDSAAGSDQEANDSGDDSNRPDRESANSEDFIAESVGGEYQENRGHEADQYQCSTEPASIKARFVRHG
jgi:hypothetical protein